MNVTGFNRANQAALQMHLISQQQGQASQLFTPINGSSGNPYLRSLIEQREANLAVYNGFQSYLGFQPSRPSRSLLPVERNYSQPNPTGWVGEERLNTTRPIQEPAAPKPSGPDPRVHELLSQKTRIDGEIGNITDRMVKLQGERNKANSKGQKQRAQQIQKLLNDLSRRRTNKRAERDRLQAEATRLSAVG